MEKSRVTQAYCGSRCRMRPIRPVFSLKLSVRTWCAAYLSRAPCRCLRSRVQKIGVVSLVDFNDLRLAVPPMQSAHDESCAWYLVGHR